VSLVALHWGPAPSPGPVVEPQGLSPGRRQAEPPHHPLRAPPPQRWVPRRGGFAGGRGWQWAGLVGTLLDTSSPPQGPGSQIWSL